jgi:ABC-type sugar transport system ATPase subunit
MTETDPPLLDARSISKQFAAFQALDDVSLSVRAGEVHGLLGANGAGKSTLIGVLSGAVPPDGGSLTVADVPVALGSLTASRGAGLMVVHQELMLFPDRSVEENIYASVLPKAPFAWISARRRRRQVDAVLQRLSARVDLRSKVGDLPLSHQQLVEIGRALCAGGRVLILDEPTSSLSQPEAAGLFEAIRAIVANDAAVIFVSHRLDEVFALTDRITVLRDGRLVGSWNTRDTDIRFITHAMVGQLAEEKPRPARRSEGRTALAFSGHLPGFAKIDFSVSPGEVVGLAGLEGSGVSRALEAFGGVIQTSARIVVDGRQVTFNNPLQAIEKGVVYMPPDRKVGGLWLDNSVLSNVAAAVVARMPPFETLSRLRLEQIAIERLKQVGVRGSALRNAVGSLSGGNQQRVLLGRCLEARPAVLLLSDFTRGVDVSAKVAIHGLIRSLADEGLAICITSSDLEELLGIADRIVCMRSGTIVADRASIDFDKRSLLEVVSREAA